MRKFLLIALCCFPAVTFAKFINPMDFDGSEAQKNEVIEYIKAQVHKDYCESQIDMCRDTTLRMMERENLEAFKRATQAKDKKIMNQVIKDYCLSGVDMCNYSTIDMMYKENLKASKQNLEW
ncbi:hypothetical protein JMS34_002846 [Salmonella enterica]|nr:hypothetical protein [Salmonella enterica]